MDVFALLDNLSALGVSVTLDGADLVLAPGSKVSAELLPDVRAHKGELVAWLTNRQVPADTGLAPLLDRLRHGQVWLTANLDRHMATEPCGDPVFVASLVAWVCLERLLRRLYGYPGCICESGACDPGAPVWCSACGARDREEAT